MLKNIALFLIRFYQKYISPLKKQSCRFYPTCSQYAADAISRYGFFKGCYMAFLRLSRCHPFNPGGYDPIK